MAQEPREVAEHDAEQQDEGDEPILPCVYWLAIDGDNFAAVIALAGDPEAPNDATRMKVQLVYSSDFDVLSKRIDDALLAEFGLSREDADTVVGEMQEMQPATPTARGKRGKGKQDERAAKAKELEAKAEELRKRQEAEKAAEHKAAEQKAAKAEETHKPADPAHKPPEPAHKAAPDPHAQQTQQQTKK